MKVRLTGKTKKGKERVKQCGEVWTVREQRSPARWLVAAGDTWRWVCVVGDPDFIVEVIE